MYPPTDRNDEADRSSLGKDRTSPTAPTLGPTLDLPLAGRDSVRLPEYSSTMDSLGDAFQVATPNYSKRPSGKFKFSPHFSFM